jgi:hypothetical protein
MKSLQLKGTKKINGSVCLIVVKPSTQFWKPQSHPFPPRNPDFLKKMNTRQWIQESCIIDKQKWKAKDLKISYIAVPHEPSLQFVFFFSNKRTKGALVFQGRNNLRKTNYPDLALDFVFVAFAL